MEAFSKLLLWSTQWLDMYRECISVVSWAPDQAEESMEQQKLAELAEMELVLGVRYPESQNG